MNAKNVQLSFDNVFPDVTFAQEALTVLTHTILLHRSTGNFNYSPGSTSRFQIETVGLIDDELNCIRLAGCASLGKSSGGLRTNIRYPFIRVNCEQLDRYVRTEIARLVNSVQSNSLYISFYRNVPKEKGLWQGLAPAVETSVWEMYKISFRIDDTHAVAMGDHYHQRHDTEKLSRDAVAIGKELAELTLIAIQEISLNQVYVPPIPHDQSILSQVFSTQFGQCQPYLFRLSTDEGSLASTPDGTRKPFQSINASPGPGAAGDDRAGTPSGRRNSGSKGIANRGMDLINVTKKFTNQLFFK